MLKKGFAIPAIILGGAALAASALFVFPGFIGSGDSNAVAQNPQWVEQVGAGLIGPACGSSSAGSTCSGPNPIVTINWTDDSAAPCIGGYPLRLVILDPTPDPITGRYNYYLDTTVIGCTGSYTWTAPFSNYTYQYFISLNSDTHFINTQDSVSTSGVPLTTFSTPNCVPPNPDPYGWHDSASCTENLGWACDSSDYNAALDVHFYEGATFLGAVTANQTREPAVGAACGGNPNHGFTWPTPASLKDNNPHSITAYAINTPVGNNPQLSGSPKSITCVVPVFYTLSVNSSGASSVAVTSSTGHGGTTNYSIASINSGTSVSLTAPSTSGGMNFSSWIGCDSVSGNTCSLTMNAARTPTANYTAPPIIASCSAFPTSRNVGESATWTATAASGGNGGPYTYTWLGTDSLSGTGNPLSHTYLSTGIHTASVAVSDGAGNNGTFACSNSVTVSQATGADLDTQNLAYGFSGGNVLKAGNQLILSGNVRNRNSPGGSAPPTTARFCIDASSNNACLNGTEPARIVSNHVVPALSAGQSSPLITSSPWTIPTGTASHTGIFCADVDNDILESGNPNSEGPNNCSSITIPAPAQCANGINDDPLEDALIDTADPGCHSDGIPGNAASYVYSDNNEVNAECSDGIDNSDPEDQPPYATTYLADQNDAGCHSDADASNAASYNINDNDETNTQCTDGYDNADAEDTLIDAADPGCHTDGNRNNALSYLRTDNDETFLTACQDNSDNDGDGKIDNVSPTMDPGCHTDGNPNNPASYDPYDNDERDINFREVFAPITRPLASLLGF